MRHRGAARQGWSQVSSSASSMAPLTLDASNATRMPRAMDRSPRRGASSATRRTSPLRTAAICEL